MLRRGFHSSLPGDERAPGGDRGTLYTLEQHTPTAGACCAARDDYSEDTWDVREGGVRPPLPRNCMRVCRCSIVQ